MLERMARPLRHLYALLVVLEGWVIFRAPDFFTAMSYLCNMVDIKIGAATTSSLSTALNHQGTCALIAGLILGDTGLEMGRDMVGGEIGKVVRSPGRHGPGHLRRRPVGQGLDPADPPRRQK